MRRTPSAEARLTAGEFRLGDRSKRWEQTRQTLCVPRALSDQETTPPGQARRAYGDLKEFERWLTGKWDKGGEARCALQKDRRKSGDTQTCNAFEASAAHGWPRVRGF
jgi:hypothetical protein